jgi:hypothetical protein
VLTNDVSRFNRTLYLSFPSQVDDVDAMRCRDGRLQYPGVLSFLIIALPMTIILLNEVVGEAIIDAAIPAVYSAILTLGAFLYSISLAALLITFCLALAAVNYWTFVYHPASVAHSCRKDKLRRLQYEGHSTSKFNRLRSIRATKSSKPRTGYLRRLLNIIKRSIQHGITLLSVRRTRSARRFAMTKKWCGMNRLSLSQGAIRSEEGSPYQMSPDSVSKRYVKVKSAYRVPEKIINMLAAARSPKLIEASMTSINSGASEHVVMTASKLNHLRAVTPSYIFTSREAISFLRSRLSETYGHSIAEHMDVTETSLIAEFRLMLDIFYPDGVALSLAEKTEACDQFNDWKDSVNDHFTLRFDDATALEVRMIRVSIFEEWFKKKFFSILRSNLPDRLLDSSLRHVPDMKKRLERIHAMLPRQTVGHI